MGEKTNNDAKPLAELPPIAVAILDFLIAGLGSILMGQMKKGIVWFIIVFACFALGYVTIFIGFIVAFVFKLLLAIDAFKLATKQANGSPIKEGETSFKILGLPLGLLGVEYVPFE
uniref:TM2 domain-containing protein n=1 Tax=Percolomonas cosmopolitus TaxID=63605 RepID=A0A7S1PJM3_9EUKA|mmetsp:Transcript_9821/g.36635  ORF Transcript_9821/g.36635 Transcript_9821/m.36635 type:complete len:116 (+) Transcript_9821:82-429(+)